MILEEKKNWWIAYRTVTRTPTDMSHLGSNWDDVQMGEWMEAGAYVDKAEAGRHFWILKNKGYDCRLHEITHTKTKITLLDPPKPKDML